MRPYAEVDTAWLVACLALTAVGVLAALMTFRKRGATAGVRVLGWGLLPIAIWLTGLSRLLWTVVLEGVRWVGGLAFSPRVWIGVVLFFVAFVMLGGVGFVRRRRARKSGKASKEGKSGKEGRSGKAGKAGKEGKSGKEGKAEGDGQPGKTAAASGDGATQKESGAPKGETEKTSQQSDPLEGMEDIEAILKRRGIE